MINTSNSNDAGGGAQLDLTIRLDRDGGYHAVLIASTGEEIPIQHSRRLDAFVAALLAHERIAPNIPAVGH